MVYGRRYGQQELHFEASGALMNASLIMRDRETDSWWSIMRGEAIGGRLEGQPLTELAVSEKATWGDWRRRYPASRVLSVDGREHEPQNPYAGYFTSDQTFRNLQVSDDRLSAKTPIFAFHLDGKAYAVPHATLVGGREIAVGGRRLVLHRSAGASVFQSTRAHEATGARKALPGFDTFWYNWVANNPASEVLE